MSRPKTVELADALPFLGTDRGMFNHWLKEGAFQTEFGKTTPGVARKLTRDNCLEVSFFVASHGAFSSSGHPSPVPQAVFFAQKFLSDEKKKRLAEFWVPGQAFVDGSISVSELAKKIGNRRSGINSRMENQARRLQLVNLAEIVRDIDELFELCGSDG